MVMDPTGLSIGNIVLIVEHTNMPSSALGLYGCRYINRYLGYSAQYCVCNWPPQRTLQLHSCAVSPCAFERCGGLLPADPILLNWCDTFTSRLIFIDFDFVTFAPLVARCGCEAIAYIMCDCWCVHYNNNHMYNKSDTFANTFVTQHVWNETHYNIP